MEKKATTISSKVAVATLLRRCPKPHFRARPFCLKRLFRNASGPLAPSYLPGGTMRILLSVTLLFSLFLIGCGGAAAPEPEGPDNSVDLTEEDEEAEMELQNESSGDE